MSLSPEASPAAPAAPAPSLFGRVAAVFVRPTAAWAGLEDRVQWWFPAVLVALVSGAMMLPLYQRAYLPTYFDQLDSQIASGAIEPAQAEKAQEIMESPVMAPVVAGTAAVGSLVVVMGIALLVWFGVSFVLGAKFRYRLALEVTAWCSLVWIPRDLAFFALAWTQETMKGIHFGLAAFLPEADPPSKWHSFAAVLLDTIGPFNVWFVALAVLGCAALSGAPRRNIAWVLGSLTLALGLVSAVLTAWLAPAS